MLGDCASQNDGHRLPRKGGSAELGAKHFSHRKAGFEQDMGQYFFPVAIDFLSGCRPACYFRHTRESH